MPNVILNYSPNNVLICSDRNLGLLTENIRNNVKRKPVFVKRKRRMLIMPNKNLQYLKFLATKGIARKSITY